MNNQMQKIIILGIGLFLIVNFVYNEKKEACAQEASAEEPLAVCQKITIDYSQCVSKSVCGSEEIDISLIQAPGNPPLCCSEKTVENELEIPIGRLVDQTENLAKRVLIKTDQVLGALSYTGSIDVDQYCKVENCQAQCEKILEQQACIENGLDCATELGEEYEPYDDCDPECDEETSQCCYWPAHCELDEDLPCIGQACSSELTTILDGLINQTENTQQRIEDLEQIVEDEIDEIKEKLTESRKKLFLCSRSPTAEEVIELQEEAIESEEETILREYTFLMNCRDVIQDGISIYSILDQKLQGYCYGNQYCQATGIPEPCAEDYYCCH